jgi:hypothetical protein
MSADSSSWSEKATELERNDHCIRPAMFVVLFFAFENLRVHSSRLSNKNDYFLFIAKYDVPLSPGH